MLKKIVAVVILGFCLAALSACNTVDGVGKDVESVGEGIQKTTQ